ncbi:MAG: hypothetical protein D6805_00410 [Planctomycetota bacterium]|nr:MAG: hypothetical protein D6805_00410 [Planctomycetota bacterium]
MRWYKYFLDIGVMVGVMILSWACYPRKKSAKLPPPVPFELEKLLLEDVRYFEFTDVLEFERDGVSFQMQLVPEGEFIRGSPFQDDERPVRKVYLHSYYIDRYEVTNQQYRAFLRAVKRYGHRYCHPEERRRFGDRKDHFPGRKGVITSLPSDYFTSPRYNQYPVVMVDWYDAYAYANWLGNRLPSEAEWEKAARGKFGQRYPWGNALPTARTARYRANVPEGELPLLPVDALSEGRSPYKVYQMAGNVLEWVFDYYSADYYKHSPLKNPINRRRAPYRSARGGGYVHTREEITSTYRFYFSPLERLPYLGFRTIRLLKE